MPIPLRPRRPELLWLWRDLSENGPMQLSAMFLLLIAGVIPTQTPASPANSKSDTDLEARLLDLYKREAAEYQIYRDDDRKQKLELRAEPVFRWTNPGHFSGAVFVWTYRGRAEAVGTIFSGPDRDRRVVYHEFHTLSLAVLHPVRPGPKRWSPQTGIELKPVSGAPVPVESAPLRLAQMRTLAREFTAHSVGGNGQRWELRLLPQPLYRYESTTPDVVDGAMFSLVSSEGTDPEIILIIEARETDAGPRWHYALARFSDKNLWVQHKKQEVWSSILGADNTYEHDAKHRYRIYLDKRIPEIGGTPDSPDGTEIRQ